jgi:hypothetical protein
MYASSLLDRFVSRFIQLSCFAAVRKSNISGKVPMLTSQKVIDPPSLRLQRDEMRPPLFISPIRCSFVPC